MLSAKRARLIKVGANVLLFGSLLVGPYVRGYVRARALVVRYAELAACVYGGAPAEAPGLGMPIASESYFAARLMSGASDFPKRCLTLLDTLVPEPAIFVFPAVKRAEADLAEVRDLVRRELAPLALRVPSARVPMRPLRAVEKLRAVVSEEALAGGMLEVPSADAVDFRSAQKLPVPTRVPLYAQSDARISFSGSDTELTTIALDGRGVSYVSVGRGGMDPRRTPRPKLLEAFLPLHAGGAFVWAMPQHRCRERENGCSAKAMGVGLSDVPWTALPVPRWLGAHPAGRVDRSVWFGQNELVVLAELSEGLRGVRRFELDLSVPPESADLPPLSASERGSARFVGEGQLIVRGATAHVLAVARPETPARPSGPAAPPAPLKLVLAPTAGEQPPLDIAHATFAAGTPWVSSCMSGDTVRFVWGDTQAFQAGFVGADGVAHSFEPVSLRIEQPVDVTDATFDHLRVVCAAPGRDGAPAVRVLARDANARVHAYVADDSATALREVSVATDVRAFSQLATKNGVLVAYAGVGEGAQVRVVTLDQRGESRAPVMVPAACFSPAGGLCGAPLLARVGERIVLGAREGTDLLALESVDEGAHFVALRGLGRTD